MSLVLVDSGAFLALEDPDEASHGRCRETLRKLVAEGRRLFTTNFVFDETYTLLLVRLGRDRAVAWGESFRRGRLVELVRVREEDEERAWEIIVEYDDKDFSYTDATSFAVAESLEIEDAFALDRHFEQYGRFRIFP